jgi:molybdate transport system substrate-binding protein
MTRLMTSRLTVLLLVITLVPPVSAHSGAGLTVAAAANFGAPLREIINIFEKLNYDNVEITLASTGKLYTQVISGAPYDLLLAADQDHPRRLFDQGLAAEPVIFARGRVVLWTARKELCGGGSWQEVLQRPEVKRLALANPETAPYGAAARTALEVTGLWGLIQPKLVFGQSIAQAFQYASTTSADAGFCALSEALSEAGQQGCHWDLPEAPEVVQALVVLKRAGNQALAQKFAAFLNSPEAQEMKRKYGYQ